MSNWVLNRFGSLVKTPGGPILPASVPTWFVLPPVYPVPFMNTEENSSLSTKEEGWDCSFEINATCCS